MDAIKQGSEKNRQEHLKHLLHLPNTQEIAAKLEKRKAEPPPTGFLPTFTARVWESSVNALTNDLKDARERDGILSTRPEGCWCLGSGFPFTTIKADDEGRMRVAPPKYCPCPEGQRQKQIDDAERERERQAKIEIIWGQADIPLRFHNMTLSTSPLLKSRPKLIPSLRQRLTDVNGEDSALYIWGGHGVGKTGLAVGYAYEWLTRCCDKVLFRSLPKLLAELRATYGRYKGDVEGEESHEEALITRFLSMPLLILDDLGAEQISGSGWVEDRLYRIIGERHSEMRPTVFTSNLNLEQLAARIGERITWRIVEMCGKSGIIELKGPNLRDF